MRDTNFLTSTEADQLPSFFGFHFSLKTTTLMPPPLRAEGAISPW